MVKGVILAGGDGKRINGCHDKASKVLIEVRGTTLIEFNMALIAPYVDEFIVVVGDARDSIIKAVGDTFDDKSVGYVTQRVRDGPLGAFRCAVPYIGEGDDVLLVLGDEYIIGERIGEAVGMFMREHPPVILGMVSDSDVEDIAKNYSMEYNQDGCVNKVVEKPVVFPNKDRGIGYYIISAEVTDMAFHVPPRDNGQYELADLFNYCIDILGPRIRAVCIADAEYNVNTKEVMDELQNGCD